MIATPSMDLGCLIYIDMGVYKGYKKTRPIGDKTAPTALY
jgi:hypothetical protein